MRFLLWLSVLLLAASCHDRPTFAVVDAGDEMRVHIDGAELAIAPPGGGWRFAMSRHGSARAGELITRGNRTTVRRGAVDEWYVSHNHSIEHGYTFYEGGDHIAVELTIDGLDARQVSPSQLALDDDSGRQRLMYSDLKAFDAAGRILPSTLRGHGKRITLSVDAKGATYPVTIDPNICWTTLQKLVASDAMPMFQFGLDVAIDGDTLVVGAGTPSRAYIFERSAGVWSETQILNPPGASSGSFVNAVDIDGNFLVLGSNTQSSTHVGAGAAYVYRHDGMQWLYEATLSNSAAKSFERYGSDVAISNDTVIVGERGVDSIAVSAGAAHVHQRIGMTWPLQQTLTPNDLSVGAAFGDAVAIEGDVAVVGAHSQHATFPDEGFVYTFDRSGNMWNQQPTLMAPAGFAGNTGRFGRAIAMDGDTLLVGQQDQSSQLPYSTAHVFSRDMGGGWNLETQVDPPAIPDSSYGQSVDLNGTWLAVGAFASNPGADGLVYVFTGSGSSWTLEQTLAPPMTVPGTLYFGHGVAIEEKHAVVGAHRDDIERGAVFIQAVVGETCLNDADCPSRFCVDNVCCNERCGDGCGDCATGICTPLPDGDSGGCSPHLCDGISLACPPCVNDMDCIADHRCDGATCVPLKADGETCGNGIECLNGLCIDDVCCDAICGEQCRACDVAGSEGTCSAVMGDPHGSRTPCQPDTCANGIASLGFACMGGDNCQVGETVQCAPYVCAPTSCRTSCTSNAHCISEHICSGSVCVPLGGEGGGPVMPPCDCAPYGCNAAGECLTGCTANDQCADGFVCDSGGVCIETPPLNEIPGACSSRVVARRIPLWPMWLLLPLLVRRPLRRRSTGSSPAR